MHMIPFQVILPEIHVSHPFQSLFISDYKHSRKKDCVVCLGLQRNYVMIRYIFVRWKEYGVQITRPGYISFYVGPL